MDPVVEKVIAEQQDNQRNNMQRELRIIYDDENQKELSKAIGYVSFFLSVSEAVATDMIKRYNKITTIDLTNLPKINQTIV